MHVFIVIPIHNHIAETLRCLECLSAQTCADHTVIVVDGGSTDGSAETIGRSFPKAIVLQGDDSLWWTGATAQGVTHARKLARPGDFILFLNNDTEVGPDYLTELVSASQDRDRALTGSLNVNRLDPRMIIDSGVWWDWEAVRSQQVQIEVGATSTDRVNTLSGRGMLVPVEVFDRIGNLDVKRLPHYAADFEFAMRAARAGFKLSVSYKAIVRVDTTITGREENLATPVSLREAWFLLFSPRSMRNVRDRMRLIACACPSRYKLRNYLAVFAAAGWLLTNLPGLFQVKHAVLRLILPARLKDWMRQRKLMPSHS